MLVKGRGIQGDAHAGPGMRQVSLLSAESVRAQAELAEAKKTGIQIRAGIYAENITTEGVDLAALKIKDRLKVGKTAVLEISKIGKECHSHCEIYHKIGDCIMPREGVFAEVISGGEIAVGDTIERV